MEKQTDPFKDFLIASHDPLKDLKRSNCPKCKGSRMYFCYTCYKYVEGIDKELLPIVKLPISVDIIKHPKEVDGKSTSVHATLLAPDDVHIYTYPIFPDYGNEKEDIVLLFPGPDAKTIEHFSKKSSSLKRCLVDEENVDTSAKRQKSNDKDVVDKQCCSESVDKLSSSETINSDSLQPTFKKIVMIDSTWNQVHAIITDERLKGIPCIELTQQSTLYWRRQNNSPDTFLSTIEALHAFVKRYHEIFIGKYDKQYDNLLYFFKFFYEMVKRNKALKKDPIK